MFKITPGQRWITTKKQDSSQISILEIKRLGCQCLFENRCHCIIISDPLISTDLDIKVNQEIGYHKYRFMPDNDDSQRHTKYLKNQEAPKEI